jgi:hypothetical protein
MFCIARGLRITRNSAIRFAIICIVLFIPGLANSHGGGLDFHGCHNNRKAGGYHCHQGANTGKQYTSKQEMLTGTPGMVVTQEKQKSNNKPTLSNSSH